MTHFENLFELGYQEGRDFLKARAGLLINSRKPALIEPAIRYMAVKALPPYPAGPRENGWFGRLMAVPIQKEFLHAYTGYQDAVQFCVDAFGKLLSEMQSDLNGSDPEFAGMVDFELIRIRNRRKGLLDARSHLAKAYEIGYDPSSNPGHDEASAYIIGFANGQMDLQMDAAQGGDYTVETVLESLFPVLTDCTIPFPLAPPALTGWDGEFTKAQTKAFEAGITAFDEAKTTLIDVYLRIRFEKDVDDFFKLMESNQ